jgi:exonuclease III
MDPSKNICWNVRGLNSSSRQSAVRELVSSFRAEVVCIQETKIEEISRFSVLSWLGADFADFVFLPSVGASGGIMVAWKSHLGFTGASRIDNHSVSIQFRKENGTCWWLTCVYGPQDDQEKVMFLQELRYNMNVCNGPWLVVGDFNIILQAIDKNNSNLNCPMMHRFSRLIEDVALKEIPLHGRRFTWSNQREAPVLIKLDRVFCSVDLELIFPNVLLQSSASIDSDHYPLILELHDNVSGKRRFHFEAFWIKLEGFQDVVQTAWDSFIEEICPFQTFF